MESGETSEDLAAAVAIGSAAGIGAIRFRRLIERFGAAGAALAGSPGDWGEAMEVPWEEAKRCHAAAVGSAAREAASRLVTEALREGVWALPLGGRGYPPLLSRIPDPPPVLFGRGKLPSPDRPSIAVVGSRRASIYGVRQASAFTEAFAAAGLPIVSGGARGIDAEAHRAALRSASWRSGSIDGLTVAVLGSGHSRPYPSEHRELFDSIVSARGAVVSEHPPWVEARPEFFPRRNRIVSGLSVGVLLVEAGARSGAGITARLAVDDQDRMAWAIPGRIGDRGSEGTNRAIREGWVACVTGPEDLLEDLAFAGHLLRGAGVPAGRDGSAAASVARADPPLAPDEAALLSRIREQGEIALEAIDLEGDGRAIAALTVLEMIGLVHNREGVVFAA